MYVCGGKLNLHNPGEKIIRKQIPLREVRSPSSHEQFLLAVYRWMSINYNSFTVARQGNFVLNVTVTAGFELNSVQKVFLPCDFNLDRLKKQLPFRSHSRFSVACHKTSDCKDSSTCCGFAFLPPSAHTHPELIYLLILLCSHSHTLLSHLQLNVSRFHRAACETVNFCQTTHTMSCESPSTKSVWFDLYLFSPSADPWTASSRGADELKLRSVCFSSSSLQVRKQV